MVWGGYGMAPHRALSNGCEPGQAGARPTIPALFVSRTFADRLPAGSRLAGRWGECRTASGPRLDRARTAPETLVGSGRRP